MFDSVSFSRYLFLLFLSYRRSNSLPTNLPSLPSHITQPSLKMFRVSKQTQSCLPAMRFDPMIPNTYYCQFFRLSTSRMQFDETYQKRISETFSLDVSSTLLLFDHRKEIKDSLDRTCIAPPPPSIFMRQGALKPSINQDQANQ